jgi:UDP-3-O-[3-hydroxymyristoyl] N-acetylglucosamine deacetylase
MKQVNPPYRVTQRTLAREITYVGVGLHSGQKVAMTVQPAPPDTGILFLRTDVEAGRGLIPARWYSVSDTRMSTTLENEYGTSVATVEHLLAGLSGCGIDNAIIEIDGPEVPIMDGSSEPFVNLIERIGTIDQDKQRYAIWIQKPIDMQLEDKYAVLLPSRIPRITVSIDFPNPAIGFQTFSVELINEAFRKDIARARTFGFAEQITQLQQHGLALGGSLRNAVLVDGDRIVNEEGLRYENEFVRHKILDCFGDLSLAGMPVIGHYYAHKPGHHINSLLLNKLFDSHGSWSYVSIDDYNRFMGISVNHSVTEDEMQLADVRKIRADEQG